MFLYYIIMAFFKNLPFQDLEHCLFPPQCCDTLIHFLILWWLSNRIILTLLHNCFFFCYCFEFSFWTSPRYLNYGLSCRISFQSQFIRGVLVLPAVSLFYFPFPLFQLPSWFETVSKNEHYTEVNLSRDHSEWNPVWRSGGYCVRRRKNTIAKQPKKKFTVVWLEANWQGGNLSEAETKSWKPLKLLMIQREKLGTKWFVVCYWARLGLIWWGWSMVRYSWSEDTIVPNIIVEK